MTLSEGTVSLISNTTVQLSGNLVESATSGVSVFAWSRIPTTGGGSIGGDIPTTGAGGSSWTTVDTTGGGQITGQQEVA